MNKLQKYYSSYLPHALIIALSYIVLFTIVSLTNPSNVVSFLNMISMALFIGLSQGLLISLVHFHDEQVSIPKQKKRMLNCPPISLFKEIGFYEQDDYLIGTYKGYTCKIWWSLDISYDMGTYSNAINLAVSHHFDLKALTERYKDKNLIWSEYNIAIHKEFAFRMPSYE